MTLTRVGIHHLRREYMGDANILGNNARNWTRRSKTELRRTLKLTTYILPNDATVKAVFDELGNNLVVEPKSLTLRKENNSSFEKWPVDDEASIGDCGLHWYFVQLT